MFLQSTTNIFYYRFFPRMKSARLSRSVSSILLMNFSFSIAYDKWHQGGLLATRDYLEKFLLSSKHLSQTYSQPLNFAFGSPYSVASSSSLQTPAPQRSKSPSQKALSIQPKSNDVRSLPIRATLALVVMSNFKNGSTF